MSVTQKSILKSYKRRIRKKIDEVEEDASNACSTIQEITNKLKEKATYLLEQSDEEFYAKYQKLQKDIEWLSDKLFLCLDFFAVSAENDTETEKDVEEGAHVHLSPPMSPVTTVSRTSSDANAATEKQQSWDSAICLDTQIADTPKTQTENTHSANSSTSKPVAAKTCQRSTSNDELLTTPKQLDSSNLQNLSNPSVDVLQELPAYWQNNQAATQPPSTVFHSAENIPISLPLSSIFTICKNIQREVPRPNIPDEAFVANITNFNSPSDFWLHIENAAIDEFLSSCQGIFVDRSEVEAIRYCLASFGQYGLCRAEIKELILDGSDLEAQIFFIDYGIVSRVPAAKLCSFPEVMYQYPAQAVPCFLHGVNPVDNEWSEQVTREFDDVVCCSDLLVSVLSTDNKKYGVSLNFTVNMPEGNVDVDTAEMLCLKNLAVPTHPDKFAVMMSSKPEIFNSSLHFSLIDADKKSYAPEVVPLRCDLSEQNNLVESERLDVEPSQLESSGHSDEIFQSDDDNLYDIQHDLDRRGPSESEFTVGEEEKADPLDDFDIDAVVPLPQPLLIQDDLLIVIPSTVYSPSYFYANSSTGNSLDIDELRDQMTSFYSLHEDSTSLDLEDVKEDRYYACPFEDGCWYRAQINILYSAKEGEDGPTAVVFYIDYGNEHVTPVKRLRPLTVRFARYPAMAILCSLAYIKPKTKQQVNPNKAGTGSSSGLKWDQRTTDRFLELTSDEKPLTAQIAKFANLKESRILHEVFLWISDGKCDRIINDILVEEGFAEYTHSVDALPDFFVRKKAPRNDDPDLEKLAAWDPMTEDFTSVENSYGVDLDDPEISVVGYKATDESYICKYYAANEPCLRGKNCPYRHVRAGYEGGTVDQEAVYLYENAIDLPKTGTFCLVQVSHFMSPGHFYVIFPYGVQAIEQIQDTPDRWMDQQKEFQELTIEMSRHYNKSPFDENTVVALAYGTIVAAKAGVDTMWYRARVIEVDDIDKPVELYYVDFGTKEWVNRRNIRSIEPRFLHCPFQAVEAFLTNIAPKKSEKGKKWSMRSKSIFNDLVSGKVLLAHIDQHIGSALYVTVQVTSGSPGIVINDFLVRENEAEFVEIGSTNYSDGKKACAETAGVIVAPG